MVSIGERLREERLRLGLSQTEMAEAGGATKKTHGLYERGERSPTADYLYALIETGIDVPYIFTGNHMVTATDSPESHVHPAGLEVFGKELNNLTLEFQKLKQRYVAESTGEYFAAPNVESAKPALRNFFAHEQWAEQILRSVIIDVLKTVEADEESFEPEDIANYVINLILAENGSSQVTDHRSISWKTKQVKRS